MKPFTYWEDLGKPEKTWENLGFWSIQVKLDLGNGKKNLKPGILGLIAPGKWPK